MEMKIFIFALWFYDYTIQLANALSKKETVMLVLPNKVSRGRRNAGDVRERHRTKRNSE